MGWLDDDATLWGARREGLEVLGGVDWLRTPQAEGAGVIVAIGDTRARVAVWERVAALGVPLINAIHPSATVLRSVKMGRGNCVCAGAVISTRTRIGNAVIINAGAIISHDCVVEDGGWIAPGVTLAGGTTVCRFGHVSTGAVLTAGVRVGEGSVVTAGAVVTEDIPPGVVVMGIPARVIHPIDGSFDWNRLYSGARAK